MKKDNYKTVQLGRGEMGVYDFGDVKLHAYKTNDFLSNEVFIIEKSGRALIDNFANTFGAVFEASIRTVTNIIYEGAVTIAGVKMNITKTMEAFDIEIPEINTVYTHMLGHDCHSIVAGAGHADAIIAQLKAYMDKGYDLVLTSHYTPEDMKDVETKIAYLENVKVIASRESFAEEFKTAVAKEYDGYSGGSYLDMTAGFFFPDLINQFPC